MTAREESVAQDQLVDFVRRIESIEDEKKVLGEDLSGIYKDARGQGFEVKVLRAIIAARRKDAVERAEFETIYDLYWAAIHGVAPAHVEIIEEFDAETGEILTPSPPVLTTPSAKTSSAAEDGGSRAATITESAQAENLAETPSAAGADKAAQPIHESTAARMDVPGSPPVIENRPALGESGDGYLHKDSERPLDTKEGSHQSRVAGAQAGTQAPPVDTIPVASDLTAAGAQPAAAPAPKRQWKFNDPAHHDCLRPEMCGGFSNLGLCPGCKAEAASSRQVVAA